MPDGRRALTPVASALQQVLDGIEPLADVEELPLERAGGRVLAEDCRAAIDVPPFANSAMDGYAVDFGLLRQGQRSFRVGSRVAAGDAPGTLSAGEAARIFTGAPMPAGADTVVIQENCSRDGDTITVRQSPARAGENVRVAGCDIARGSVVANRGDRLSAALTGTLASCGRGVLTVSRRLRVLVLTTGDELVPPGHPLEPGQIHDANSFLLANLLSDPGREVIRAPLALADTLQATRDALLEAAARADAVVTCGGVSAGEEDHVRRALEEVGELSVWKLALKPGKPFAFGHVDAVPFFGLPGNPVSSHVTAQLLVQPALARLAGATSVLPARYRLRAGFSCGPSGEREEYLRVTLRNDAGAEQSVIPLPEQSSGVLTSVSRADGLAVIPPFTAIREGDILEFLPFTDR